MISTDSEDTALRLSAWLRARAPKVLERWAARGPTLLGDGLPALLADMARAAERPDCGDTGFIDLHQRFEREVDLSQVVQECAALRRLLHEVLGRDVRRLSPDDLLCLERMIDGVIAGTVESQAGLRARAQSSLKRLSNLVMAAGPNVGQLLADLIALMLELPSVDAVAILVKEGSQLRVVASSGFAPAVEDAPPTPEARLAQAIADRRHPILLRAGAEGPDDPPLPEALGLLYGVPLEVGGLLVGVSYLASRSSAVQSEDKLLFHAVASQAAGAIAQGLFGVRERAETAVTRALAGAESFDEAVPKLLEGMGLTLGWDVGHFWVPDADRRALVLSRSWTAADYDDTAFGATSRAIHFGPNEGLPGRAWQSRTAHWIADIHDESNFPRKAAAMADGLRSAVGFPLLAGQEFLGVFEFFSRDCRSPAEQGVQVTGVLAGQLTPFIERLAARDAIRASEAQKAAILEVALDSIISMDGQGRVTAWNPSAERTFGFPRAEAIGQKLSDLIIPHHLRAGHARGLEHYLETGEGPILGRRVELPALRRDGSELPVELTVTVIRDTGAPWFTGYLRDITERKRTEDELRQAAVFREQLLAIVGHDLRSPLSTISAAAQLLPLQSDPDKRAQITARIASSVERMSRLISDLLDLAQGHLGGGIPIAPEDADLHEIIGQVIDELAVAWPGRPITLDAHANPHGVWDSGRLGQVVSNLLGNALQHSPAGTPIAVTTDDVTTRDGDGRVRLAVHNHGPAIPDNLLPHLFEPFRRAESAERRGGSMGLGLYIVDQIVKAHGGAVEVCSTDAAGTTFTVSLPRRAEPRTA